MKLLFCPPKVGIYGDQPGSLIWPLSASSNEHIIAET